MDCHDDAAACRAKAAELLGLKPNRQPGRDGDWEGKCPECGHGGFALSKPTATKMRNMWVCHCQVCNGGRGCPTKVTRAAMIQKGIHPWCLGSYIGKDKPEADSDELRKLAQVVDDLLACGPKLFTVSEMLMLLADARGSKIPGEYGPCASYAKGLGISNGTAYKIAEKFTGGSGSRPAGLEVPPQTGGGSHDISRTTPARNGVKCQGQSLETFQQLENGPDQASNSWKETALGDGETFPTVGIPTLGNQSDRRVA